MYTRTWMTWCVRWWWPASSERWTRTQLQQPRHESATSRRSRVSRAGLRPTRELWSSRRSTRHVHVRKRQRLITGQSVNVHSRPTQPSIPTGSANDGTWATEVRLASGELSSNRPRHWVCLLPAEDHWNKDEHSYLMRQTPNSYLMPPQRGFSWNCVTPDGLKTRMMGLRDRA